MNLKRELIATVFIVKIVVLSGQVGCSSASTNSKDVESTPDTGDVITVIDVILPNADITTPDSVFDTSTDSFTTPDVADANIDSMTVQHPILTPFPPVSQCAPACTTAADCTKEPTGPGAFGPEEWECTQGGCRYAGCTSSDSCKESLGKTLDVVCNEGVVPPSCDFLCTSNENCGFTSDPDGGALGDDNYTCEDQVCHYQGCKNDEECVTSYFTFPQNYHCQPFDGAPSRCLPTCTTSEDCVLADPPGGAYGLDNWECQQGACRWLGCFTAEECDISTPGTSKRVCLPPP